MSESLDNKGIAVISPEQVDENLRLIEDLKFFLATAPANWQKNQIIRRYYLNHDEGFVSCVYWNNLYFITGTDIVRCIVYRFELFGRVIIDRKKFEEGIFSDLRGLKCGTDAVLEPSKSPFLDFLHKSSCLRTQKKQKVFFWFSAPHDNLFTDALERDLKKEVQNQLGTTKARSEPSLSFKYDPTKNLSEQLLEFTRRDTPVEEASHVNDENSTIPMNSSTTPIFGSGFDTPQDNGISPQVVTVNDENEDHTSLQPNESTLADFDITHSLIRDDDDFPLDFFPSPIHQFPHFAPQMDASGHILIDPSIFLNQPESYNEQSLLDQTYAKTPFFQTEFDQKTRSTSTAPLPQDQSQNEGEEDEYHDLFNPQRTPQAIQFQPPGYYPNQFYPAQPMPSSFSNAQYYDAQASGQPFDVDNFEIPYQMQIASPQPVFYYPPPAPPPAPQVFMYDPYGQVAGFADPTMPYMNDFAGAGADDQFLYDNCGVMSSPFGRFFPSFQAAAPPQSPLNSQQRQPQLGRFGDGNGKVSKPSNLKHTNSKKNDREGKFIMTQINRSVIENTQQQQTNETAAASDYQQDGEYNSLPTPESTAPDQRNRNNNQHSNGISLGDTVEPEEEDKEEEEEKEELASILESKGRDLDDSLADAINGKEDE